MLGVLFWGFFLILLGLSVILEAFFGIKLPVIRFFIGIFLVYLGLQFLMDLRHEKIEYKLINKKGHYSYHTLFGSNFIDLSTIDVEYIKSTDKPIQVTISTTFGNSRVKINPTIPTKVITHSSFSRTTLPDETAITFGKHVYQTYRDNGQVQLIIEANTLFGNLDIYSCHK